MNSVDTFVFESEKPITRKEVVNTFLRVLNEANLLDPNAIKALVNNRVPCNEKLAEHKTIQVNGEIGMAQVGLLGVINGICDALVGCRIAIFQADPDTIVKFIEFTSEAIGATCKKTNDQCGCKD